MERRSNHEWSRMNGYNPINSQMPGYQPVSAGNRPNGVSKNYPFEPAEFNSYNPIMDAYENLGVMNSANTFNLNPYDIDSSLLSDYLSQLRLAESLPTQSVPLMASAAPYGRSRAFPVAQEMPFSYADYEREFHQGLAKATRDQMGFYTQPRSYPTTLYGYNGISDHSNGFNDCDPMRSYNYNSRRSLNREAMEFFPRAHRSAHRYGIWDPKENRSINPRNATRNGFGIGSNFQYRGESTNELDAFLTSGLHNGSRQPFSWLSLEEVRGNILAMANDQHGCRFMQDKLQERKPEDVQLIHMELKDHVYDLMTTQFGNYLLQKFFEVCSENQMTEVLYSVINRNLKEICVHANGTRVMQKMIGHLTTREQRTALISALRGITLSLTKNTNGYHVIQNCFMSFPCDESKHLLNVVADNCLEIAMDRSGCCVMQQCVGYSEGEESDRLVAQIITNALVLSEDAYGNFVVQYLIGLGNRHVTSDILLRLSASFASLAMNKYGSNVVEKCLKETDQSAKVIEELIKDPKKFLMVIQDPYGNYVAQSALGMAKGRLYNMMVTFINENYAYLHSHPHGKRVLARTRRSSKPRL